MTKNNEKILNLIDSLTPKIKGSLRNTNRNEQEDLEQEIKIKIIEKADAVFDGKTVGFFEFLEQKNMSYSDERL